MKHHPTDKFAALYENVENSGAPVMATFRAIARLQDRYEEANDAESPATPSRVRMFASGISHNGQTFAVVVSE